MKLKLSLSRDIIVDTSDIDPDLLTEAIAECSLFTDENGDELKKFSDLDESEITAVIHRLLENDIDSVCDINSEVDASDFTITIPESEPPK